MNSSTMSVGLLTIHDIYNYGSILQTYATRHAAAKLQKPVQIIDYKYPNELHKGSSLQPSSVARAALKAGNGFLKDLLPARPYSTYMRRYAEAREAWYGQTTCAYPTREAIRHNPPLCRTYMVGSDQVWHPRSAASDPTFFLDFASPGSRRVSYASSFGAVTIPAGLFAEYAKRIREFDALGVRERPGVQLVKELTGRNATLTLDPTLLLDGDFWRGEAVFPEDEEPYIVCYGSNQGSNYMERLALHLGRQTGWKVVRLNGKFHNAFDRRMRYVLDAGPREWLGYLAKARLVIGQSFHATAFAVNFGKPLISLLRGQLDHDSRQLDFLDLVGLSKAALMVGSPLPTLEDLLMEPNHEAVERLLAEHRDRSFDYLKGALA
jgi:Polysaccharide pyruvyl transferase